MVWDAYVEAQNITTVLKLMQYGNTVTDGVFGMTIAFSVFVISIVMTYGRVKIEDSILVSSFITWFFAVLMKALGLVGDQTVVIFIMLTAVSVIAAVVQKREIDY